MKSAGSYIGSFIISILLIFTLIGSAVCVIADSFMTPDNMIKITEEKNVSKLVYDELEKYFKERSAVTGIPADIYMDNINEDYLRSLIQRSIRNGFSEMSNKFAAETAYDKAPEETNLENDLHKYFKEYAQSVGYVIKDTDDPYFVKLKNMQENAESTINEYCDVFKLTALSKHGILSKVKPVFDNLSTIKILCLGASAFLALMMLVFNFKAVKDVLYWVGSCGISAGILGVIPCLYLLKTDYFAAFTIKQAQIYTAYTSALISFTEKIMSSFVIIAGIGIVFIVLYIICSAISNKTAKDENK